MSLPKKRKNRRPSISAKAPKPPAAKRDRMLRCSFCGKSQNEVQKLIAGRQVYICNECIDICNEIIADDREHGL